MDETKLKKIEALLELVDTKKNAEDLVAAFKTAIEELLKIRKDNEQEVTDAIALLKKTSEEFITGLNTTLNTTTDTTLTDVKTTVEKRLNAALTDASAKVSQMLKEQATGMNLVRDKLASIESGAPGEPGTPGAPGKDANEKVVADSVLSELLPLLEEEVAKIRAELKTSLGSRVGWGAHPLTIAKSGTTKSETTRYINFVGTGVSSVTRNPDDTVDVSISGGSATIYTETPTGNIDGSNKTYTTAHTTTTIIGIWINGEYIHTGEYTTNASGFTMVTALDASLNGKGFSISYT